ncbi:nucleocapsid protein [Yaba-7 virus]|uniref:Nucleoprotein n=1 Tax=Yaba-7 virus TaxID=159137 RepID=Q8QZ63_9VIRU|nr:nucleocapsid protein [Yaba-7 virus]AAL78231.1 nucleocapsid protein [Yaba-7 virus]AXP32088.1 nucleocapsid protein [Yaba-7 virus]
MANQFVFNDVPQRNAATFNPDTGYVAFISKYGQHLNFSVARVFFLNQKKAKMVLHKTPQPSVDLTFAGVKFTVVNNHFPQYTANTVSDTAFTLHRISGYLARWVAEQCKGNQIKLAEAAATIVMPLAEIKGCTWNDGYTMYLGFAPGAEMFLETFEFYPLVIDMHRVLKDGMDVNFMRKVLRQRYGQLTAEEWMTTKVDAVKAAFGSVAQISWAKSGFSPAARAFLTQFGIQI